MPRRCRAESCEADAIGGCANRRLYVIEARLGQPSADVREPGAASFGCQHVPLALVERDCVVQSARGLLRAPHQFQDFGEVGERVCVGR